MGIIHLAFSDLAVFSISSPPILATIMLRGGFSFFCIHSFHCGPPYWPPLCYAGDFQSYCLLLFVGLRSANVIDHIHRYVVHHFPISSLPPPRNFSQKARPTAHRQLIGRSDSQGPKCIKATSAVTDSILTYVLIAVASIIAFRQTVEIKYE